MTFYVITVDLNDLNVESPVYQRLSTGDILRNAVGWNVENVEKAKHLTEMRRKTD